jgi:hypothetical protein
MGKGGGGGGGNSGAEMMAAMAQLQAAQLQYQLGKESLDWAKDVYKENYPYILENTQQGLEAQRLSNKFAKRQMDIYESDYLPMEQQYNRDVQAWDTPERQQQRAGEAQGMVASQFEQARQAAASQLESFGVDPSSTRYAALDIGARTAQAATAAGAGTKAIQDTRLEGMQLRSGAINTGRGYPNAVNAGFGVGSSAGSAAAGALTNYFGTGAQARNGAVQWFQAGNQGMGNAIQGFNNSRSNDISYMRARNEQSSGIGSALGLIGSIFNFEEGGAVPAPPGPQGALPAPPPGGSTGGAVPISASPSSGEQVDDIPARLNAGEFVYPKDVVSWLGEKEMYKQIDKAREERERVLAETDAKPELRPAIPAPPTFRSAPA